MVEQARLSVKVLVGSSISTGQNQYSTLDRLCKMVIMSIMDELPTAIIEQLTSNL